MTRKGTSKFPTGRSINIEGMKAILVGLGNFSRHWFEVCTQHDDVEIVGFVARSQKSRDAFSTTFSITESSLFSSLSEAIDACDADFVVDVTPPAAHREIAITAIEAGLHVLQEKPMCDSMADAREVAAAGKQAGIVHMVSQNFRFGALPRTTRRLISEGYIGNPGQLAVSFYVPWADLPGTHYVKEPYMFLTDMGVHHFDMMRYVLGMEALSVRVESWNLPWGWHSGDASHIALFDFPNGIKASHVALGCTLGHPTSWNGDWRIDGDMGTITWENSSIYFSREHRTESMIRREIAIDPLSSTGQMAVLDEFLTAVEEHREPECSAKDNLLSLKMAFGAVESAKSGERVDLIAVA